MKIFSWKTKESGNFFPKSSAVFSEFLTTKSNFDRKTSAQLSKLDSALPSGPFVETHVLPKKNPMNNCLQIFSGVLVFLSFFGMIIDKASLCLNECFEGHFIFFEKRKVFEIFPALGRRIFILWRWISNRLSKMRFFRLNELFQGDCFFSEKKFNSLVFPLKKWPQLFKKFITMNFWQKTSARLSQLDSTLPRGLFAGFFPGKESIAKTFSQLERKFVKFFCRKKSAD